VIRLDDRGKNAVPPQEFEPDVADQQPFIPQVVGVSDRLPPQSATVVRPLPALATPDGPPVIDHPPEHNVLDGEQRRIAVPGLHCVAVVGNHNLDREPFR
jgi:hypothetical protein